MSRTLRVSLDQVLLACVFAATASAQGTLQHLVQFAGGGGNPQGGLVRGADGMLYGTTVDGGRGHGSVYRFDPAATTPSLVTIHAFSGPDGTDPWGRLLLASDGNFYGMTAGGGASVGGFGSVFKLTAAGVLTTLYSFSGPDGAFPRSGLIEASDGNFYGTTSGGGPSFNGTVFRLTPAGGFTLLHSFNGSDGNSPYGEVVEGSDGALYGTTLFGGASDRGTVFRLNPSTGAVTTLVSFDLTINPGVPGSLVRGSGGTMYGATNGGGPANGAGIVFQITEGGAFTTIATLPAGSFSNGCVTLGSDGNLYVVADDVSGYGSRVFKVALNGAMEAFAFDQAFGGQAEAPLFENSNGVFYGTTVRGGLGGDGIVYRLTPGSTPALTSVAAFGSPRAVSLKKSRDGGFYGVTATWHAYSPFGTVFRISAGGAWSSLYLYGGQQGRVLGVAEGSDGTLYGTTSDNADLSVTTGGTVFKIAPDGTATTLVDAIGSAGQPASPPIVASDGNIYGMTALFNPTSTVSTVSVFRVTPSGTLSNLATVPDSSPSGALLEGRDGNFYGVSTYSSDLLTVTPAGAATRRNLATSEILGMYPTGPLVSGLDGSIYGIAQCRSGCNPDGQPRTSHLAVAGSGLGLVYRLAANGTLTRLAYFQGYLQRAVSGAQLASGPDGNVYLTTADTIFRLTPGGTLTPLRVFSRADGLAPASLIVNGPRDIYGVTTTEGALGGGSIFHLTDIAPVLSAAYSGASPLVAPQNVVASGVVTATDVDDAANLLTFRVVAQGAKGTAVVNAATGAFTYTPVHGARGRDAFSIVASDPFGDSNVVTVFVVIPPLAPAPRDADGDGRGDMTTYDGSGRWKILKSSSGYVSSTTIDWGGAGYVPVAGDYDGDGEMDPAVYQSATGQWLALLSSTNYTGAFIINWGGAGYAPAPGDYDGDGKIDLGVYLRATGQWFVLKSGAGYTTAFTVTTNRGTPVPGLDFDGDGRSDVAVFHGSTWTIVTSNSGFASATDSTLGGAAVTLVAGDYDGDGKADPAVYERATGRWRVLRSSDATTLDVAWGGAGFDPVPDDYDGDGIIDIAVVERATGNWSARLSTTGFSTTLNVSGWGASSETLISSAMPVVVDDAARASDADADGYADLTVYNPTSGRWNTLRSASNYVAPLTTNWGGAGYTPVPGDYDGDGKADRALYQASTGNWLVLLSGSNFTTSLTKNAGGAGYIPVPADYDGDGKTDFAVYNATSGLWYALKSSTNYTTTLAVNWGGPVYTPVPADFDGDGRADLALYAPSTGDWHVLLSNANFTTALNKNVGGTGYSPVPGDFDGDGKADFAVYNATTGLWYGLLSGSAYTTTMSIGWGGTGYAPVKGDFDGDGRADLGLFQASSGTWYVLLSGANYTTTLIRVWGAAGEIPVPMYP